MRRTRRGPVRVLFSDQPALSRYTLIHARRIVYLIPVFMARLLNPLSFLRLLAWYPLISIDNRYARPILLLE